VINLHWSFHDDFGLTLTLCESGRELGRLEWTRHRLPPEVLESPGAASRARSEELTDRLNTQGAIASALNCAGSKQQLAQVPLTQPDGAIVRG
jgi:hypothetical protein